MSAVPKLLVREQETFVSATGGREKFEKRFVRVVLLMTLAFTVLAVYSLILNDKIETKFYLVDRTKRENIDMRRQIELLDAEITYLKSYERVEKALGDAGLQLVVPSSVFYLDLQEVNGQVAVKTTNRSAKEQM